MLVDIVVVDVVDGVAAVSAYVDICCCDVVVHAVAVDVAAEAVLLLVLLLCYGLC